MPTKRSAAKGRPVAPAAEPAPPVAALPVSAPAIAAPAPPPPAPGYRLPEPAGGWRALGLLLAVVQPWAGLTLALLYWPAPEGRGRRFSRWCLVLALVGGALAALCMAVWNAMQNAEGGIQPW